MRHQGFCKGLWCLRSRLCLGKAQGGFVSSQLMPPAEFEKVFVLLIVMSTNTEIIVRQEMSVGFCAEQKELRVSEFRAGSFWGGRKRQQGKMENGTSVWLGFSIPTALVSVLNQEPRAEIWAFCFSLSFSQKIQKNSTKCYLSNSSKKLQNWNVGSERSAGATPLSCPLGFLLLRGAGGAPRKWPWKS